jgi:hypothetical protein
VSKKKKKKNYKKKKTASHATAERRLEPDHACDRNAVAVAAAVDVDMILGYHRDMRGSRDCVPRGRNPVLDKDNRHFYIKRKRKKTEKKKEKKKKKKCF